MIKWTGQTTDKRVTYTAEGNTWQEVYYDITGTYGYDFIHVDGETIEDLEEEKGSKFTDEDYKELILESNSQAYYQNYKNE